MKSIEILNEMIEGCENVRKDPDSSDPVKNLASLVKKDCQRVIREIQIETGRIA